MGYAEELEYWSSMGLTGFDRDSAANGGRFNREEDEDFDNEETEEETDGE